MEKRIRQEGSASRIHLGVNEFLVMENASARRIRNQPQRRRHARAKQRRNDSELGQRVDRVVVDERLDLSLRRRRVDEEQGGEQRRGLVDLRHEAGEHERWRRRADDLLLLLRRELMMMMMPRRSGRRSEFLLDRGLVLLQLLWCRLEGGVDLVGDDFWRGKVSEQRSEIFVVVGCEGEMDAAFLICRVVIGWRKQEKRNVETSDLTQRCGDARNGGVIFEGDFIRRESAQLFQILGVSEIDLWIFCEEEQRSPRLLGEIVVGCAAR